MTTPHSIFGICAAVLTPLDERLEPDAAKAIPYYRGLLNAGCHSLNVLGTTGEALSLPVRQRLDFMEKIAASGIPLDRIMVGTSAAALTDAIELTQHAVALGFAAALIMPPRLTTTIDDDGIVSYYCAIADTLKRSRDCIFLYNFPRLSGISFSVELIRRLIAKLPGVIVGIKDSSNDLELEKLLLQEHPKLAIFPSSECHLLTARRLGLAGCISGTVCLWPQKARALWDAANDSNADDFQRELCSRRAAVESYGLIPSVRFLTAVAERDESWQRTLPPLSALAETERTALLSALQDETHTEARP